ncbi:MAG TPA: peptidoglycan DD-metalloendopeptidase family protein [Acidimicrobiia bacterium]|nr:peptidoglycan DD-metalloendopeptidase family protein [Acidimicrobiia bacterium]
MTRRLVLCLLAGVLLLGVLAPDVARGQSSPDPKAQRDELAGAIEDASAEEVSAVQELQGITAQRQELEAKVAALDAQISEATQRVRAAEAEIARIQAQIDTVQRDIDRIKAEIEASKQKFNESVLALYKGGSNGSNSFTLLSTGGGTHELIAGSKYLGENSRQFERELQRQGSLKDQLDDAQSDLRKEQVKAQEAQQVAAAERDRVTQLRTQADAERAQVAAAEQHEQQVIEGIRARKADFEAQYNAVQAQIAAMVSRGNPTPGNHRFTWPVNGSISSGFGERVHPIYGTERMHTGVDIAASQGTPIKAAGDGVVKMAGPNGGYGNWTLIDNGGGLATGYGHQSRIAVSIGQHVSTGDVIGYVGSTGASTGPHLHWEVRVNGNPVDPMGWV